MHLRAYELGKNFSKKDPTGQKPFDVVRNCWLICGVLMIASASPPPSGDPMSLSMPLNLAQLDCICRS